MSEPPEQAETSKQKWVVRLLLVLVVFFSVLPFSSRAVYMDEHIFLRLANSAQTNWLFPSDTPALFFGRQADNFANHTHPPVGEYYLAGLYLLIGQFHEVPFRLLYMLFPLLALFGFYGLACRFTANPLGTTLLLAFSPTFFASSPTLMMDMPTLAFLLVGLTLYFKSVDGESRMLIPASACFILAVGSGYTALVPLACLGGWAVVARRPYRELWAIGAVPLALSLWLAMMTVHYGAFPLTATVVEFVSHTRSTFHNVMVSFSFLGGVGIVPWAFLWLTDVPKKLWLCGLGVVTVALLTVFLEWPSFQYRLWFLFLAASGLAMLVAFASTPLWQRSRERVPGHGFLLLWGSSVLIFFILVADMINARYLLLALPALYLVLFQQASWRATRLVLVPTLMVSLIVSAADYRFVNSYRTWVREVVVPLQEQGFTIWSGAESGLRFYLEENDIETLHSQDIRPRGGDLIIRPAQLFRYSLGSDLEPLLIHLRTDELTDSFPVRTFNPMAGAGFHDSHIGLVPYNLSTASYDRLEIVQLSPLVEKLPQQVPEDYADVAVWSPSGVVLKQVQPVLTFPVRIPQNTRILYDLEGEGSLEVHSDAITLTRSDPNLILWQNLRIVPREWFRSQ